MSNVKNRAAKITRKTNETQIELELNIDGTGKYSIDMPIGFLKHMLELFAKHGLFDLQIKCSGDIEIDFHHTVEDLGIVLGAAFKQALSDMRGIKRYGFFILPMDEAIAEVSLDICNRSILVYNVNLPGEKIANFDVELFREFFEKFALNAGITLHINLRNANNAHHGIEAIFKCFAKALDIATQYDSRIQGLNTTKGLL